jgi:hypothetical protein
MADKAYVMVANMKVDKTFDNKYKSSLPKAMKAAAEGAIKSSSNMTTQKPSNKDAKCYSLDATVTSLTQNGKNLEAKLSMALSEDDKMFGFLNGNGKLQNGNPKQLDGDVEDLVGGVIESLVKGKVSQAIQQKIAKGP